ncbi:MAG: S53 family peptidase [Acidobacteriota bacterium]
MTAPSEENPGFEPRAMAEHYGLTIPDDGGAGQRVAIVSLGGQLDKDELLADLVHVGTHLDPGKLSIVHIDAPALTPGGSAIETHLDVEILGSLCPAAEITIYRAPNNYFIGFEPAVRRAIADGNQVISISWGGREAEWFPTSTFADAFLEAARRSVTVCVAVGDGGSGDQRDGIHAVPAPDGAVHVELPAVSPWVLACGGTEAMRDGSEHVWNNAAIGRGATGGGVSEFVPRPDYQRDLDIVSASTGHAGRIVPDVAALGSFTSWEVAIEAGQQLFYNGGTSAVTPFWTGIVVLANQRRAAAGLQPLGFFNDHLYTLAAERSDLLYDVIVGDNRPIASYPGYSAGPGFDACTGWGTPRHADHWIEALAALPDRPAAWFSSIG